MNSVTFKMDDGLKKGLEEAAKKTRQSKSRFIREAIIEKISKMILEGK